MSLEETNSRVNTLTAQFLMLAMDQTEGLTRVLRHEIQTTDDPDLVKTLELTINHITLLQRVSIKLSEENAELYDRYIKFLADLNSKL